MRTLVHRLNFALALAGVWLTLCGILRAQTQTATDKIVEVYLYSSRSISLPGASRVFAFDTDIAAAELEGPDIIRLVGLERGETIAIATVDGKSTSFIVHVIPQPVILPPPSFHMDLERGYGFLASDAQIALSGGQTNFSLLNNLSWTQKIGDRRLDVNAVVEDQTQTGMHAINPRNGWINYVTPRVEINALDFNQDLTGDLPQNRFPTYTVSNFVQLRGARVTFVRGRDRFSVFGGTTLPFYFLTLARTRDIAGFAFNRQQTEKFSWSTTTSYVNVPQAGGNGARAGSVMQMNGFHYAPSERWLLDAAEGFSNHGTLMRSNADYLAPSWSAFGSFLRSSPQFPLNQIQSLFAGTTSLRGGASFGTNSPLSETIYYEHTLTNSGILSIGHAVSDYLSPAVSYRLSSRDLANFTYTYSRNTGGFSTGTQIGHRYNIGLNSTLPRGIGNTAQFRLGQVQDPLGLQSQDELAFDDSLSLPTKVGTLFVSYSHNRVNPSLVQKLNQELGLLSPQLQQLFLQNPAGFVTTDLPPEIRALLESQIPVSSSVTANLQMHIRRRFLISPNVAFTHSDSASQREMWNHFFGYALTYQLSPSVLLRSWLSSVWTTRTPQSGLQRSTILTVGIQRSFNGLPTPHGFFRGSNTIEGRVFRDDNINGTYNSGEAGFEGIEVQLDDGAIERTDKEGHFRFIDVRAGLHRVSMSPAQFSTPIRMTTPSEIAVDLTGHRAASSDFGVVDFARLMGNVFNDLRFEGKRQLDSVPIGDIQLQLNQNGNVVRTIAVLAGGTFEVNNLAPGDYDLAVDASTVPANYAITTAHFPIHIAPVSTVAIDIPLRAMRSISGHVYLKVVEGGTGQEKEKINIQRAQAKSVKDGRNNHHDQAQNKEQQGPKVKLVPLAGVQLTADHTVVRTDSEGAFALRDLAAGDLTVKLIPLKSLPPDMKVPSGLIHMPAEPIFIQGASIVISNPELLPYLTDLHEQSRELSQY